MQLTFTDATKDAIAYSKEECIRLHYTAISPEILMLGILKGESNGAIKTIKTAYINLEKLRITFEQIAAKTSVQTETVDKDQIVLDSRTEVLLENAYLIATKRHPTGTTINTVHLLVSYLENTSEVIREELLKTHRLSIRTVDNIPSNLAMDTYPESDLWSDLEQAAEMLIEMPENTPIILSRPNDHQSKPLTLIFSLEEYNVQDIKKILTQLSLLYHTMSGDYLQISGLSDFEMINNLEHV